MSNALTITNGTTTTIPLNSLTYGQVLSVSSIPWNGTTISWEPEPTIEENMVKYLKDKLKLKIEDYGSDIMFTILLGEEEICSDFYHK